MWWRGLTRLKARYILATLSNGNVAMMVNAAKRAGIPWDTVLGAEVARAYKSERKCYETTAALLGLANGECLMVAAHDEDLQRSKGFGFRTAFVHRPDELGPGRGGNGGPAEAYDVVAEDFLDLADKLGC